MATIIKLKRSTVSSSIPTTSDLADGEVAVNTADRKIYVRNGVSIVEVANNTSAGSTDLTSVGTNIIERHCKSRRSRVTIADRHDNLYTS